MWVRLLLLSLFSTRGEVDLEVDPIINILSNVKCDENMDRLLFMAGYIATQAYRVIG